MRDTVPEKQVTVQPTSLLSPEASQPGRVPSSGIRSPWVSLVPLRISPEDAHVGETSPALPAARSLGQFVVSYSAVICALLISLFFLYFHRHLGLFLDSPFCLLYLG